MPYYVVNAGRGRSTHIMESSSPSTPNPASVGGVVADLLWFGGNPKSTLCGLQATRYVDVFTPAEASCRECKKRWQLKAAAERQKAAQRLEREERQAAQRLEREERQTRQRRERWVASRERWVASSCQAEFEASSNKLIPALPEGVTAKANRCPRCGRKTADHSRFFRAKWFSDGSHLDLAGERWCPGPGDRRQTR
jgi:hypothetical protein